MIQKGKNLQDRGIIAIILLALIHFISSYKLLEQSKVFRTGDECGYLTSSFNMFFSPAKVLLINFFQISLDICRPKSFIVVGTIFWKLLDAFRQFPNEILMILLPNLFFLIILMSAVYGIIKILYEDKELALLGAFLISFTPIVYSLIRVYLFDFPLMSMVVLSIFVLLKTNDFKSKFYCLVAGIIFFLSQITKETSLIFILPVAACYLIYSLKNNAGESRTILTNFLIFLTTFALLSLFIYGVSLDTCLLRYKAVPYENYWNAGMFFYLFSFSLGYFHPLFCLLLGILFFIYLKDIKFMDKQILLLVWLIFPLIIFSFFPNKEIRYILPAIPAFLIAGIGVLRNENLFRKIFIFLLVMTSIFQWGVLTYYPQFLNYSVNLHKHRARNNYRYRGLDRIGVPSVLDESRDWVVYQKFNEDLVKTIKLDNPKRVNLLSLFWFKELRYTFLRTMLYNKEINRWQINFFPASCELTKRVKKYNYLEQYKRANYILYLKEDNHGQDPCAQRRWIFDRLKERLKEDEASGKLNLLKDITLGGQTFYLYKKVSELPPKK